MTISTLQEHIGYWHNRLGQKIALTFEQRLKHLDVTLSQWCVLISLYHRQANTVSELARQLMIDVGAITRLVDRLVDKQLVERFVNDSDTRSNVLNLTSKALELIPKLAREADCNDHHFFSALSDAEILLYKQLITKLLIANRIGIDEQWQFKMLKQI